MHKPKLERSGPKSIGRSFTRMTSSSTKIVAKANQLGVSVVGLERWRTAALKVCIDTEFLGSTMALNLIPDLDSYDDLTDEAQ